MATSVGQIGLDLVINQQKFNKQLTGINSMAKKVGASLVAAFSVKQIVDFGKSCIDLGSDLQEVQNVVDVTFPRMSAQVDEFAKKAAASFGLSETMAKRYTGTFGAMAKAFGFTEQQAYDMSTTLTGLAGDIASFYNITQDEAYTKLKSVFSGETETLKDLGIVMTQNALDAYAMANGWGKTTQAMSEAEKVALRYAFVQDQLSAASGDFIRTSDSWANQIRILQLQFASLKATIGQGLINVLTPVLTVINTILGKLMTLANAFKAFTELLTGKKSSSKATASGLTDIAESAAGASAGLNSVGNSAAGAGSAAKKAAKDIGSLGIDELNTLKTNDSSSGSGGGGGGAGGGSAIDFGTLSAEETVLDTISDKYTKMFEDIREQIKPTTDAFKKLWKEGLSKFGEFSWEALKDFYNGFLVPVAKWTMGEGIPRFLDALNEGLMSVDWDKLNDALEDLWEALAPFAINIGEGLLWFWEEVLVPLGVWVANEVITRFFEELASLFTILNNVIEKLDPVFEWLIENAIKPLVQLIGDGFLNRWDRLNEILELFSGRSEEASTGVGALVEELTGIVGIGKFVAQLFEDMSKAFRDSWNQISHSVTTVWNLLSEFFSELKLACEETWTRVKEIFSPVAEWFREKFQAAYDKITGIFKGIGNWFRGKYNEIKQVFSTVNTWFAEKFGAAYTGVKNAFKDIKQWAKNRYQDVKDGFSGVKEWFREKFGGAFQAMQESFSGVGQWASGLWDQITRSFTNIGTKIGEAVGRAFKDAMNSALQTIENTINNGISLINKCIDAINTISPIDIGHIGNVSLPRLAQGGYVRANTPQLAVIGDNRHYGEIVAPEDKLMDMINTALSMRDAQNSDGDPMFQVQLLTLLQQIISILEALDLTPNIDIYQLKKNLDDVGKRKGFSF